MRFISMAVVVLLVAALSQSLRAADEQRPRYSLKEDDPKTGSNIRRSIVSDSVVPLDKGYAELSPEQQAYIKSQYEQMGPDDEPPYPVGGVGQLYKMIASGQRRLNVTGSMTLIVEVNSHGHAESVSVLQSPDPDMVKFAASVLMLQEFKPALCKGSACTMPFPFRFTFEKRF